MPVSSAVSAGDSVLASQYNNLRTDALNRADLQTFTANGTWTKPSWATWVEVVCIGAGGGGGGGYVGYSDGVRSRSGGSGGGGGATARGVFRASDLGATETVTVGVGGVGGTGSAANTSATPYNGANGGPSSFGTWLNAGGGGGGTQGNRSGTSSYELGGAGGALTSANFTTPGVPSAFTISTIRDGIGIQGADVGGSGTVDGYNSEWGGASGSAGGSGGDSGKGGSSIYGGAAGGGGGGVDQAGTGHAGGAGGTIQSTTTGGGGAGGATGGTGVAGTAGTANTTLKKGYCGSGGGGGGSSTTAGSVAGIGGAGGIPGGGGGGSGAATEIIAFDSYNSSSGASPVTYTQVVSGTNRILLVACGTTAGTTVTGVTYNGVALSKIVADSGNGESLWYLIAPATGSHSVVVTATGGGNVKSICASYTGVKQTGQPDSGVDSHFANTSPQTLNTTIVSEECFLVGMAWCASNSNTAFTVGLNGNLLLEIHDATAEALVLADSAHAIGKGSQGISFTHAGTITVFSGIVVSLAPVSLVGSSGGAGARGEVRVYSY